MLPYAHAAIKYVCGVAVIAACDRSFSETEIAGGIKKNYCGGDQWVKYAHLLSMYHLFIGNHPTFESKLEAADAIVKVQVAE